MSALFLFGNTILEAKLIVSMNVHKIILQTLAIEDVGNMRVNALLLGQLMEKNALIHVIN